ncbi:unnamed protein product [Psylliodes chrysocephalus]|uniref:Epoxide hydrolase n=1 Tax=Psylliodes chrysocephalus TaxID=3402493 RepID=A0A9P0GB51_9CUCU|nr:unnamed protein product [Psylliodes chrysocephala]
MGTGSTLFAILIVGLGVFSYVKIKPIFDVPEKPDLGEPWWKVSKPTKVDTSIRPFKIQVSNEILKDLKDRLDRALPFQKSLEGVKQHYGMNDKLLTSIIDFWKTKYNWTQREKILNQYPQFKTNIQGLDIHYIHVKPAQTQGIKVLPLLMVHGWPGSVREFYEIIPILTTPKKGQNFVFELIIPSLPGYGFSEAAEVPGLNTHQMAVIFKNLMTRLGFEKFYVQGGDWGGIIVSSLAVFFPEKIIGMHSNMCFVNTPLSNIKLALGSYYPSLIIEEEHQHLVYPRMEKIGNLFLETGYLHIQATKPDTVGVALRDSPVGLAAYILEKFTTWTNPDWKDLEDGGLTKKYKMENLLDNIMIYWVTRSITTSQRLYAESFSKATMSLQIDSIPTDVPSACAAFKHDLTLIPPSLLKEKYTNLLQSNILDGGHFAAFEVPQVLATDVFEFVTKVENLSQKPKSSPTN